MKPLGDTARHLRLLHDMAAHVGVDPVAAAAEGRLGQSDWAAMVQVCRGCGWAEDCPDWLGRTGEVAVAPPTCLNRAALAALTRDGAG